MHSGSFIKAFHHLVIRYSALASSKLDVHILCILLPYTVILDLLDIKENIMFHPFDSHRGKLVMGKYQSKGYAS